MHVCLRRFIGQARAMEFAKLRTLTTFCLATGFIVVLFTGAFLSNRQLRLVHSLHDRSDLDIEVASARARRVLQAYRAGHLDLEEFDIPEHILRSRVNVNFSQHDVLVFLHIQKTGGTSFGRHLVRHIRGLPCACQRGRKKCECLAPANKHKLWLFSRYSTGWACGLHADWTELHACVDPKLDRKEGRHRPRSYYYITLLRDPFQRYLSEWQHVRRGATWRTARLECQGRRAHIPSCYAGEDWFGVDLDAFAACPYNLANNRQARMLANLSIVQCYNFTAMSAKQRDQLVLSSAQHNLAHMPFVGLTEYQTLNQYLFSRTFGLMFTELFTQLPTLSANFNISVRQRDHVLQVLNLDVIMYQYAQQIFFSRARYFLGHEQLLTADVRHSIAKRPIAQLINDWQWLSTIAEGVLRRLGAQEGSDMYQVRQREKVHQKLIDAGMKDSGHAN